MHVNFNGKYEQAPDGTDLLTFLRSRSLEPDKLVVEYNNKISAREEWSAEPLRDGDVIVALTIVGGG